MKRLQICYLKRVNAKNNGECRTVIKTVWNYTCGSLGYSHLEVCWIQAVEFCTSLHQTYFTCSKFLFLSDMKEVTEGVGLHRNSAPLYQRNNDQASVRILGYDYFYLLQSLSKSKSEAAQLRNYSMSVWYIVNVVFWQSESNNLTACSHLTD